MAADKNDCSKSLLSSAFETADHQLLIHRSNSMAVILVYLTGLLIFGFGGWVLVWFCFFIIQFSWLSSLLYSLYILIRSYYQQFWNSFLSFLCQDHSTVLLFETSWPGYPAQSTVLMQSGCKARWQIIAPENISAQAASGVPVIHSKL